MAASNPKTPPAGTPERPVDSFERLILQLEQLPGIGRRSAERIAYHMLEASKDEAMALAYAIRDVKKNLHPCEICGDLTESARCTLCQDPRREANVLCVVEWPREVRALEKTGLFKGRYHVLMGRLSPLSGVEPSDLRISGLLERLKGGAVREVILATSPTMEGDATASYIAQRIAELTPPPRTTRLARGVPEGSDLSFAQSGTLGEALKGRTELPSLHR